MENDLSLLPWKPNQLHYVDNYLEAVGVMTAIKAGIPTESVMRPLKSTSVSTERIVLTPKQVSHKSKAK